MAKVLETTPTVKAFYAILFDADGTLAKINGEIVFLDGATGELVSIEPSMCNFLTVLGEAGLADTQQLLDRMHGGYAAIACQRPAA